VHPFEAVIDAVDEAITAVTDIPLDA